MAEGTQSQGSERIFDRETLLDLTVNFIPLGIILFFVVLFAIFRPFGVDLVATVISMGLLIIPFAALAVLTYFAGKVISEAEKGGESETTENVAETAIGEGEGPADDGDFSGADQPSTGQQGTAAPAGAGTDRSQRTGSSSDGDDDSDDPAAVEDESEGEPDAETDSSETDNGADADADTDG